MLKSTDKPSVKPSSFKNDVWYFSKYLNFEFKNDHLIVNLESIILCEKIVMSLVVIN